MFGQSSKVSRTMAWRFDEQHTWRHEDGLGLGRDAQTTPSVGRPSHKLLMRAEQQDSEIQPRVSRDASGPLRFGGRKNEKPKR